MGSNIFSHTSILLNIIHITFYKISLNYNIILYYKIKSIYDKNMKKNVIIIIIILFMMILYEKL